MKTVKGILLNLRINRDVTFDWDRRDTRYISTCTLSFSLEYITEDYAHVSISGLSLISGVYSEDKEIMTIIGRDPVGNKTRWKLKVIK